MNDLSPKAEPVGYATVVGLIVAALASYGLNITSELGQALVVVVPMLIAAWVARSKVTAPDTLEHVKRDAYTAGLNDAQGDV